MVAAVLALFACNRPAAEEPAATETLADGKVEKGSLVAKDGKGCMTPAGGEERCFTNSAPDADGSWKATNAEGGVSTIVKKPA